MNTVTSDRKPLVSVVIPSYKRPELVRKAVKSLFDQDIGFDKYEVLVVDSSPDDQVRSVVRDLQPHAPCPLHFLSKHPEGPGPSRNLGAAEARADILAFMDSDCQADPAFLRSGLAAFREGIGIVQGKTLPDPEGRLGVFTWYPCNHSEYFVYECTSIFYRRDAFEQAGGFPADPHAHEVSPLGGEDVTLAWSVKRNGWKSTFAADAIVYHEVIQISLWRWIFNKHLFVWPSLVKNFPELRQFFPVRLFFDRGQAYLALAVVGVALAVLATPYAFLLSLPYLIYRGSRPSKSCPGPLRPLRVLPYLARDTVWFLTLLAGSLRYRCVLL